MLGRSVMGGGTLKFEQLEPFCAHSCNEDMFQGMITVCVLNGASSRVLLIFMASNNGCTNAPQYYVMRTLPVLLILFSLLLTYLRRVLSNRLHFVMKFEVRKTISQIYLRSVLVFRLPLLVS